MRKCPRCRSSMIVEFVDVIEGIGRVWHCLGCGHELLADSRAQAEDERLRERIHVLPTVQRSTRAESPLGG
jgi:hypothetical protein